MRTLALALASFALLAAPALAQHNHGAHGGDHSAHAGMIQTTPADGAMGAAPGSFHIVFEHPMRLTSLVITARGGDPISVPIADSEAAAETTIALPQLAPGNYTFNWTATGADNHTMTGRVRYMIH